MCICRRVLANELITMNRNVAKLIFRLSLVSEIAMTLGISLHISKISFKRGKFLLKLLVLQCSNEKPLFPVFKIFAVFDVIIF